MMRAGDRAYSTLLRDIQSGALAPGTVLGEVEQAARLGVSRTPAREAISRLTADGLAEQLSPRVTVVSDFDADDIRALFEVRRALEESAASLAASRGDSAARAEFAKLAEAFGSARPESGEGEADAYYDLIARYDAALDRVVGNSYFTNALRTIRTHLARARQLARDNRDRLLASVAEHRLIAQAIADGNAELAAHATHVHLHNALVAIINSLGASDESNSDEARSEGTS